MIYMVEIEFTNAEREPEWNAWYSAHLHTILSVPGIETAQRFHEMSGKTPRYLAIYTIASADVFDSEAYAGIGGGGVASARWREYIRRNRNLLSGIEVVPEVTTSSRLLVCDDRARLGDIPDLMFAQLKPAALDRSVEERFLAIAGLEQIRDTALADREGLRIYEPMSPRILPRRAAS